MIRLVFATHNQGKLAELKELAAPLAVEVIPASAIPELPPVDEDGATFAENAAKKARQTARAAGLPALADDSGLQVDALAGAPGVHSARFAGPAARDAENNALLLHRLAGVPAAGRTARFVCAMAFADPLGPLGEAIQITEGQCPGVVLEAPRGTEGFGYDPLFLVPEEGRTFAELPAETKNRLSHRGQAMREMIRFLQTYLRDRPVLPPAGFFT
jgi:XTP/dITP diphosphohydrolase